MVKYMIIKLENTYFIYLLNWGFKSYSKERLYYRFLFLCKGMKCLRKILE